jgi:hypothetical protein
MSLAPGSGIILAFLILFTLSIIYGLYSRRGSGISQRPYGNPYSNAPGASGSSTIGADRAAASQLTRGTR